MRAASSAAVSRSSAMPAASFAIRLAVAGTTSATCASRTSRMWGMRSGRSQSDVYTGLPVNDANVNNVTKRSASPVITTSRSTPSPRCTSVLVSAAAL